MVHCTHVHLIELVYNPCRIPWFSYTAKHYSTWTPLQVNDRLCCPIDTRPMMTGARTMWSTKNVPRGILMCVLVCGVLSGVQTILSRLELDDVFAALYCFFPLDGLDSCSQTYGRERMCIGPVSIPEV